MIFTTVLIIALGAIVLRVMVRVVTVWSREKALAALANWAQAEALEVISVKSPLFLPISQSGPGCQFFQVVLKDGRGALLRAWIRFPDFGSEGPWSLKVTWDNEPETRLTKQQRIRLAASVATVVVVICAAIVYSTGPYYHGKSLRTWAQMLGRLDVDSTRFECGWGEEDENWNRAGQNAEAADAIRHLGSRSFSRLVHAIKAQESPWKSKLAKSLPSWLRGILPASDLTRPREGAVLALTVLGTQAGTVAPELARALHGSESRKAAALALSAIGPKGWTILTQAITDRDQGVAYAAIWALGKQRATVPGTLAALESAVSDRAPTNSRAGIACWALGRLGQDQARVIPLLVAAMDLPGNRGPNWMAFMGLSELGTNAASVVPRLVQIRKSNKPGMSDAATMALRNIDPKAAAETGDVFPGSERYGHELPPGPAGQTVPND
jgi:hypothetical protein